MKNFHGIMSSLFAVASAICFFFLTTSIGYVLGFVLMITGVIFLLFMIIEEQKETIENLRNVILKSKTK